MFTPDEDYNTINKQVMKINVFSNTFYPAVGGVESNTETLLQAIQNLNHSVSLITATPLLNKPEIKRNYHVVRSKSFGTLFKLLNKSDLVIVNGDISVPVCLASYILRVPYAIIYQMAGKIVPKGNSLSERIIFKMRLFLGSKAIIHIGVSKATLQSKNIFKKKEDILYNPVSKILDDFSRNQEIEKQPKEYDILFAGRLIDGKGINLLFEALEVLDKRKYKFKVLISGEGEEKSRLIQKSLSFTHITVSFQNFVSGKELALTFAKSKVMVLPSTTHQEGSPLSIAEAFAFHIPVIVSNQPAMIELVGNNTDLFFMSGNTVELSDKIINIMNDETYKLNVDYIKTKEKKYSYENYLVCLSRILNELV